MTKSVEKPKKKKVIRIIVPNEDIILTHDNYFTMEIEPPNENTEEEIKEAIKELMECEIE